MFREEVAEHYRAKGYTIRENVKVRGESGAVHQCDMVAQSALGNMVIAFEDAGGFEGPEMNHVRRMAQDIGATPVVAARRIPPGIGRRAAQAGVVLVDEARLHEEPPRDEADEDAEDPDYPPWPGSGERSDSDDAPAPWPRTARSRPQDRGPLRTADVDDLVQEWSHHSGPVARTKSTDPGFWSYPREGDGRVQRPDVGTKARSAEASFSWLPGQAAAPEAPGNRTPSPPRQDTASPGTGAERAATAHSGPERGGGDPVQPQPEARKASARDAPHLPAHEAPTAGLEVWHWFALAVTFGATAGGVFYALSALFG